METEIRRIVKCRSCDADIFFIRHGKKFHPVNIKPKKLFVLIKKYYDPQEDGTWQLIDCYESHFSNCPDAETWRKRKKEFYEVSGNK